MIMKAPMMARVSMEIYIDFYSVQNSKTMLSREEPCRLMIMIQSL
jgi:hypothetical protein